MNWNEILNPIELNAIDEHDCENNKDSDTAVLNCFFEVTNKTKWRLAETADIAEVDLVSKVERQGHCPK